MKNSFKLSLLLLFVIFVTSNARAQDLLNLIPKETSFVGVVDINKIKTKAGFAELAKLPFVEKMAKTIAENMFKDTVKENFANYLDLGNYGINTNGKAYFYVKNDTKVYYGAMLVSLSNEAKFSSYLKKMTADTAGSHVTVKNNLKYASIKELKIVWNDKTVAFWGAFISPTYKDSITTNLRSKYDTYNYDNNVLPDSAAIADSIAVVEASARAIVEEKRSTENIIVPDTIVESYPAEADTTNYGSSYETPYVDPYANAYSQADSICKSTVDEWCTLHQEKFLMDKGANSLVFNKDFAAFVKSQPDVALAFDYGQFASLYLGSIWRMAYMMTGNNLAVGSIMDLYKGLIVYAKIEHNKDDVALKVNVIYSEKLKEIYKDVKKKKISADFLKYMDKNLMGYCALGIDIKGVCNGIGSYLKTTLPQIPLYGEIAASSMDVLGIFIDEERLYNILSGDMVFAVNGVKPTQVIHTSYKFDDNYNRIDVTDTTTQMRPEVLLMLGLGNKSDVEKVLKLFKVSQLLKQYGNYYGLAKNNSALPVYFRIQDNILFITNSQSFAENPVVCAPDKQLGAEHANMFKKNTSIMFVDIAAITNYFAKDSTNKYQKDFIEATGLFSNITMSGTHKAGSADSQCVLKLKETGDNSMVDLIKFINTIYVNKEKVRYE